MSAVRIARRRLDSQCGESRKADGIDVRAGARDDELGDGGVRKLRCAASQERSSGCDLLLEEAVVSVLFTFLADNRSNDRD